MNELTNTMVVPVEKGAYSYIGEWTHVAQYTKIGKFCSIGNNCTIGGQQHRLDGLSTYPFEQIFEEEKWPSLPTIIGNDVWIGSNSVIKAGLTIGDGAVVGAGSVVLRDVKPYEIVAGVPADCIRYRFRFSIIKELRELKWWDLPLETIRILPKDNVHQCMDILNRLREKAA